MRQVIITESQARKLNLTEGVNTNNVFDKIWISYGTEDEFDKYKTSLAEFNFWGIHHNKPSGGLWASPTDSDHSWKDWKIWHGDDVLDNDDDEIDNNDEFASFLKALKQSGKTLDKHFLFKIDSRANIYVIDNKDDYYKYAIDQRGLILKLSFELRKQFLSNPKNSEQCKVDLKRLEQYEAENEMFGRNVMFDFINGATPLDFYRIIDEYDGVYVTSNAIRELSDEFSQWSCESICVFNPNIVIPLPENAFQKASVNRDTHIDRVKVYDAYNTYEDGIPKGMNDELNNFANLNVRKDNSDLFRGTHPAILAQGNDDDYDTLAAKTFNGTMDSGILGIGGKSLNRSQNQYAKPYYKRPPRPIIKKRDGKKYRQMNRFWR